MSETAIQIVSVSIIIAASAVVTLGCVAIAAAMWMGVVEKMRDRRDWLIRSKTAHDIGRDLLNSAWWFGEHPPTQHAVHLIGDALLRYEGFRDEVIREAWRKKNEAAR